MIEPYPGKERIIHRIMDTNFIPYYIQKRGYILSREDAAQDVLLSLCEITDERYMAIWSKDGFDGIMKYVSTIVVRRCWQEYRSSYATMVGAVEIEDWMVGSVRPYEDVLDSIKDVLTEREFELLMLYVGCGCDWIEYCNVVGCDIVNAKTKICRIKEKIRHGTKKEDTN